MKYLIFAFILIFNLPLFFSQENSYIVFFKDKGNPSLSGIQNWISPLALKKRKQHNIPFDFYDLPVSKNYLNVLNYDGKIKNASKWLNAAFVYSTYSVKELKQKHTFIKNIITLKQGKFPIRNLAGSNGSNRSDSNLYNFTYNQIELTQTGSCMHDKGKKGDGVIIAVLDAGFPKVDVLNGFSRLRNEGRIIDTWDFEDDSSFVYHKHSHGASVSSIIVGELDSTFIGGAPDATFAFYITEIGSVEINQEEYNLVLGLERADSIGADIASISLGYRDFDTLQTSYGYTGMDGQTTIASSGVRIARDKGMIVVSAAGNNGNQGVGSLSSPCDVDSILCVGAVNYDSTRASFSSEGPTFDNRIKPDVVTIGDSCYFIAQNDAAKSGNGTSFSTPLMSGMVACVKQAHPLRNNYQIINAIKQSGHMNTAPDNIFGWGIPNVCVADSILTILDSISLGLKENKVLKASVYPNPAYTSINIKTKYLLKHIAVFNMMGKQVVNYPIVNYFDSYNIPISNLKEGSYIITLVTTDGFKLSKQFIRYK